jgi:hypothetical protein
MVNLASQLMATFLNVITFVGILEVCKRGKTDLVNTFTNINYI